VAFTLHMLQLIPTIECIPRYEKDKCYRISRSIIYSKPALLSTSLIRSSFIIITCSDPTAMLKIYRLHNMHQFLHSFYVLLCKDQKLISNPWSNLEFYIESYFPILCSPYVHILISGESAIGREAGLFDSVSCTTPSLSSQSFDKTSFELSILLLSFAGCDSTI
jgi:hypothetical protein